MNKVTSSSPKNITSKEVIAVKMVVAIVLMDSKKIPIQKNEFGKRTELCANNYLCALR
jgi:hypothetical protein